LLVFQWFQTSSPISRFYSIRDAFELIKACVLIATLSAVASFVLTRLEEAPRSIPILHFMLLASGLLFLFILARAHAASRTEPGSYRFSRPIHPVRSVPIALNSHGIWLALMIALTVTNYGYPIAALVARQDTSVPAIYVGAQ